MAESLLRMPRQAFLVKEEAEIGTDSVPTGAANAMLLNNPFLSTAPRNITPVRGVNGTLMPDAPIIGTSLSNFTVTFDLKGSGTADVPPEWAELIKCCGFTVTPNVGVDVDIALTSDPKSVTIYHYVDGVLFKHLGCFGNASFTFTANERWACSVAIQGRYGGQSDAAVPAVTLDPTTAPTWTEKDVLVDSVQTHMSTFTLTMGSTIAVYDTAVTGFNGVLAALLTGHDPSSQMNPNYRLTANFDPDTLISSETSFPIALENGTVTGNMVQFNTANARVSNHTPTDDNGLVRDQVDIFFEGLNSAFAFKTL